MIADEGRNSAWTADEWVRVLALAHDLITKGYLDEAQETTESLIRRSDANDVVIANCAGFLIDIGESLERQEVIRRGIELLEGTGLAGAAGEAGRMFTYNLANGYAKMGRLELNQGGSWTYWSFHENVNWQKGKALLAPLLDARSAKIPPQVWVNYGNALSHVGRKIEALYAYDKALQIDPEYPMAMGNKGQALDAIAPILGAARAEARWEAGRLIARAIANPDLVSKVGTRPRDLWREDLTRIEAFLRRSIPPDEPPSHPECDLSTLDPVLRRYIEFCRGERLFLTYHLCDERASAALRDSVAVESEGSRSARLLDQIKEDYATARYLYFLSTQADARRDMLNTATKYSDRSFGLAPGLLKSSFRQAFDVLDKIAFVLNDHLQLGIPARKTEFLRFWRTPVDRGGPGPRVRQELRSIENFAVVGLVDLAKDLEHDRYKQTRDLRNAQTHRVLLVRNDDAQCARTPGAAYVTTAELRLETLRLLRIVKAAIFSVATIVNTDGMQPRKRRRAERLGPLPRGCSMNSL